ncbi:MAG: hypothetical protein ACHQNV_04885 [Vicinamibacteria bacterium]
MNAAEALQERARRVRARALVRRWEYRQRNHAKGVWGRLRRVLSEAAAAWSVPAGEAERLLAEGYTTDAVGAELEPPRIILFVPAARIESVPGRVNVPLRLGAELLAARYLALVRFDVGQTENQ